MDQDALPLDGSLYQPAFDGNGTHVFVIDTGCDTTSRYLSGHAVNVYDVYAATPWAPSANNDRHGHGTHCAGTVGGALVGVAPNTSIWCIKVLSDEGYGTTADVLEGMEAAYNLSRSFPGRSIISMSLGGICDHLECSTDVQLQVIDNVLTPAGIPVVVAAGNDACDACQYSPAAARTAITVAALDRDDTYAYFSNLGECVTLAAPGVEIVSACASGSFLEMYCDADSMLLTLSGTSMATPAVAGRVAQLLQQNASLTVAEVQDALQDRGVQLSRAGDNATVPVMARIYGVAEDDGVRVPPLAHGYGGVTPALCDKGWMGETCAEFFEWGPVCTAEEFVLQTKIVDETGVGTGWPASAGYTIWGDGWMKQGTLPCDIYYAEDRCVPIGSNDTSVELTVAFCDRDRSLYDARLYTGPCASIMGPLYPNEAINMWVSPDGRCMLVEGVVSLTPGSEEEEALCNSFARTVSTVAPSPSPTMNPSMGPSMGPSPGPTAPTIELASNCTCPSHTVSTSTFSITLVSVCILSLCTALAYGRWIEKRGKGGWSDGGGGGASGGGGGGGVSDEIELKEMRGGTAIL